MDMALNHEAHAEVRVLPMLPSGTEPTNVDNIRPTTPLCRAYYKLYQVGQDMLAAQQPQQSSSTLDCDLLSSLRGTVGLDIGASPGGWTKVCYMGWRVLWNL